MLEDIIRKAKEEGKKVNVYAHKFPDGDAICSSCAVVEYLQNNGVEAQYIITNPVFSFSQVVGKIPTSTQVSENDISIILDTSTKNYAENQLFDKSAVEDIYVIDHHMKKEGDNCIEDELEIPSTNFLRESNASSVCEILVNEIGPELDPSIAEKLTLGLLTDTGRLKFLKEGTLKNLATLLRTGADFNKISSVCSKKSRLSEEVGLAKLFLQSKRIQIGDTFGMVLPVDNETIRDISSRYGIRAVQKKIFKMADVENCSFNCIYAENESGEYDVEFRNNSVVGNLNVGQLATMYNGGGHYGASGCHFSQKDGYTIESILQLIEEKTSELYSAQASNVEGVQQSEYDATLSSIFERTYKLTQNVNPKVLEKISELRDCGANYDYLLKNIKTYEEFMLQNEILSRVSEQSIESKKPVVNIKLSSQDIQALTEKYGVEDEQILNAIRAFANISIGSATISLPNGAKSLIDSNGNVTFQQGGFRENIKFSKDIEEK